MMQEHRVANVLLAGLKAQAVLKRRAQNVSKMQEVCMSISQEAGTDHYVKMQIGHRMFEMAKQRELCVPNFPDSQAVLGLLAQYCLQAQKFSALQ